VTGRARADHAARPSPAPTTPERSRLAVTCRTALHRLRPGTQRARAGGADLPLWFEAPSGRASGPEARRAARHPDRTARRARSDGHAGSCRGAARAGRARGRGARRAGPSPRRASADVGRGRVEDAQDRRRVHLRRRRRRHRWARLTWLRPLRPATDAVPHPRRWRTDLHYLLQQAPHRDVLELRPRRPTRPITQRRRPPGLPALSRPCPATRHLRRLRPAAGPETLGRRRAGLLPLLPRPSGTDRTLLGLRPGPPGQCPHLIRGRGLHHLLRQDPDRHGPLRRV
jgi:hypothetical protein